MTATLHTDELPDFEGEPVESSMIRITNAGDGLTEALKVAPRALHHGEEVAILIRGTVTQINHKTVAGKKGEDDTLVRLHTVSAVAATELEMDHAKLILQAAADSLARRKAELDGQLMLDDEQAALDREALD